MSSARPVAVTTTGHRVRLPVDSAGRVSLDPIWRASDRSPAKAPGAWLTWKSGGRAAVAALVRATGRPEALLVTPRPTPDGRASYRAHPGIARLYAAWLGVRLEGLDDPGQAA